MITVRVRTPQGQLRFEMQPTDPVIKLTEMVGEKLGADKSAISLSRDPGKKEIISIFLPSLEKAQLKHGDLIFASVNETIASFAAANPWETPAAAAPQPTPTPPPTTSSPAPPSTEQQPAIEEDEIDVQLHKLDGRIQRSRPSGRQMRLEDLPIEPYDAKYLAEHKIKHMSYHAMLRKLLDRSKDSGVSGRMAIVDDGIEDLEAKAQVTDKSVVQMKELPSSIILTRQEFRMVDHIEFETSEIVNAFLNAWRTTGQQRFGYLYGRYAQYTEVPLGIKAVVSFIYEPPQMDDREAIQLLEDPDSTLVDQIAAALGLRRVGMIFTDLQDDGTGQGTVVRRRSAKTFFISCIEVVASARQQRLHPSPCRYAQTGKFGSKFVSVVASGDEEGKIHLTGYQVSNQAVAMISAGFALPTVEPDLMRVADSDVEDATPQVASSTQPVASSSSDAPSASPAPTIERRRKFIPEILFRFKNEYGTEVTLPAKPTFPVDYLIVNLTTGFPKEPTPFFTAPKPFPVENRGPVDYSAITKHLRSAGGNTLDALSDFHFLLFIAKASLFDMQHDYGLLCEVVRTRDQALLAQLLQTPSWQTVELVTQNAG